MQKGFTGVMSKFPQIPYKVVDTIAYDPAARDLSVEVAKAKASGAEALVMVSRLNDAILLTRELVKQRWSPMAVLSMGPGWYEDQYLKTLGKLADGPLSFVPWYDPNKKLTKQLEAAHTKAFPEINLNTNHVYTFEALLVAADAFKRAGSSRPKALADAIRATNIKDNVSPGPGIQFDAKGQNSQLKNSAIQNRGGKLVTVAPKAGRQRQARAADARLDALASEAGLHDVLPAEIYLNVAASGLLTGLVYGLMALGLSVIFGVVRVVNFAHGEMMTLAMYLTLVLFSALKLDPLVLLVPIAAALFVFGYLLQLGLINPVHQPAGAQPVHAAGRGRADPRQRAAHRLRSRRAGHPHGVLLRQLPARAADRRRRQGLCRRPRRWWSPRRCSPSSASRCSARRSAPAPTTTTARAWSG